MREKKQDIVISAKEKNSGCVFEATIDLKSVAQVRYRPTLHNAQSAFDEEIMMNALIWTPGTGTKGHVSDSLSYLWTKSLLRPGRGL
jgi:hypothetical protein